MANPRVKAKRQRRKRRAKVLKLRARLADTKSGSERRRLIDKITKTSRGSPVPPS